MRSLSDGSLLTDVDKQGNDFVDELAKSAAKLDRLPASQTEWVRDQWDLVTAVATWIGQATVLANSWPAPEGHRGAASKVKLRDNEGCRLPIAATRVGGNGRRLQPQSTPSPSKRALGDLSGCERWEAIRRRVLAKEQCHGEAK